MGNVYLTGPDMHLWKNPAIDDFVCLKAQKYEDFLSTWLSEKIVGRFNDTIGRHFRVRVRIDSFNLCLHEIYSLPTPQIITGILCYTSTVVLGGRPQYCLSACPPSYRYYPSWH